MPETEKPYYFRSKATLILLPSNLLQQWLDEFQKFLGKDERGQTVPLRILACKSVVQLRSATVGEICEKYDVVLCTYRLFYSPVYRRRLHELCGTHSVATMSEKEIIGVRGVNADILKLRRNTRHFREDPSQLSWDQGSNATTKSCKKRRTDAGASCEEHEDVSSLHF